MAKEQDPTDVGHYAHPDSLQKEKRLSLRAPLTLIASDEQLNAVRSANQAGLLASARLVPLELHEEITGSHLQEAGILVMHVDPTVPASMRRVEHVRSIRPDLPQIVALTSADVALVRTLLRQGVADVVGMPLCPEEVLQASVTALDERLTSNTGSEKLAPVVAVTRSLGGSGATTFVTHLAAHLAESGAKVCLFDLDVQFGRVTDVLGLQPARTLTDLLEAADRVDDAFLKSVAAGHSSGLTVIAAPKDIVPLESISADQLRQVVDVARGAYEFVFVDMPSNLTNWSLSVLARSNRTFMLVEQNLSSLRQAKRRLDLFRSVDIDSGAISVVVNRAERRLFGSISLGDVEHALGQKALGSLHSEGPNIASAQDQGLLLNQLRAKSSYVTDVRHLADALQQSLENGGNG